MAQQGHSAACCSIPPIVTKEYKEKGKYIDVNGTKCYTTGPPSATSAIFIIYDIFGYYPQTLQGADILAHADQEHQYRVFMPDFFHGKPFPKESFPAKTEEQKKALGEFFGGPANPGNTAEKVKPLIEGIGKTAEGKGIEKWGSLGLCWGGKIISLTSQPGTLFSAAAEVHPAMVSEDDAKGIKIPLCMLASGDEPAEDVAKFQEVLKAQGVPNHVETFKDQVHGWMGARGDLGNPRVKEEYERGYKTLLDFYHQHL